ncbi:hypothetical protein LNV08_14250 [Paucibacter sp. TC2R-5]|uniref:PEP-CTERM sorting domain-containing protein n=1 Tax=Paucibacter sp. TC2R-5 TaxID=2893555 RepID=UPI0021E3F49D|nr:PEP-CTERM sorting domain-containing protein [Paucibacter sp. TC2R-5]MCV2360137.1 hypothetical protein [Paucibacter sp. TC2R-5]
MSSHPQLRATLATAFTASLALSQAGPSHAITLADPSLIQSVRPDEPYGDTFWNYSTGSFSAVSSVNGSRGSVSTVLGQSPTITAEVQTGSTGYVSASNKLSYQLAYINPTGSHDWLNVSVQAFDNLLAQGSAPSGGYYRSYTWSKLSLTGPASDTVYTGYHCSSASTSAAYQPCGGTPSLPIQPFSVNLRQNTVYTVQMQLYAEANAFSNNGTAIGLASSVLDPSFAVSGAAPAGGHFIFSPGVSPVPEAASWAMLLAGLTCVAGAAQQRRRKA